MAQTRSGVVPRKSKHQTFFIRTNTVRDYLQQKIDGIVAASNKNGIKMDKISIDLFTDKMSDKFAPFVLILSTSAAEYYDDTEDVTEDGEEIFTRRSNQDGQDFDKPAILKKPIAMLYDALRYTPEDLKAFKARNYLRELEIAGIPGISRHMKYYSKPRLYTVKDGDGYITKISVYIDPIKIFHEMVMVEYDRNFEVKLHVKRKINENEFEYMVRKQARSKSKKQKNKDRDYRIQLAIRMKSSNHQKSSSDENRYNHRRRNWKRNK